MLNLKFTPNAKWPSWVAAHHAQQTLAYLQNQADKSFTITVGGQTYDLYYRLDGQQATIYSRGNAGDSVVIPSLQLNIGQWLLPVAESMVLPDSPGLNPAASQGSCREIYEGALPPEVAQAIMAKIQEVGLFKIIFNKNLTQ